MNGATNGSKRNFFAHVDDVFMFTHQQQPKNIVAVICMR